MIMDSVDPSPAHAPSHHNGSRETNPQVNDAANRSSFEGRPNGSNSDAQEGAVEGKGPRFVRKYGDVQARENSNGNPSNQTKVE